MPRLKLWNVLFALSPTLLIQELPKFSSIVTGALGRIWSPSAVTILTRPESLSAGGLTYLVVSMGSLKQYGGSAFIGLIMIVFEL